jgi:hypothetical protein
MGSDTRRRLPGGGAGGVEPGTYIVTLSVNGNPLCQ